MTVRSARPDPERELRRAWWSLTLFVPSLLAAFLVGEFLFAATGHEDDASPPIGAVLLAGGPALLVFVLPTLVVWHFGSRAQRDGRPDGRTPILVAVIVAGGFIALNLFPFVVGLVL